MAFCKGISHTVVSDEYQFSQIHESKGYETRLPINYKHIMLHTSFVFLFYNLFIYACVLINTLYFSFVLLCVLPNI